MAFYRGKSINETIICGNADDTVFGLKGKDSISGELGDDVLYGGGGNDTVNGGGGNDKIFGDVGNDLITGGGGNDAMHGGAGNDTFDFSTGDGNDTVDGDSGSDTVDYSSVTGSLIIVGGTEAFQAYTGTTQIGRLYDIEKIIAVNGTLEGGTDDDGFKVDLSKALQTVSGLLSLKNLVGFVNVTGGSGNDSITGSSDANRINGGNGNDTLYVSSGEDTYDGGNGDDSLDFTGKSFPAKDALILDISEGELNYNNTEVLFSNIEYLLGSKNKTDVMDASGITGSVGVGVYINMGTALGSVEFGIEAASSLSDLKGVLGFEIVYGGSGNDTLIGGDPSERLEGRSGADTLMGGKGNDTLIGGEGNDRLYGGKDTDTFIEQLNDGADTLDGGDGIDNYILTDANDGLDKAVTVDVHAGTVTRNGETDTLINIEKVYGTDATNDVIAATNDTDGVSINMTTGVMSGSNSGITALYYFENLSGGSGNDILIGNTGANKLEGNDGNDSLDGMGGNDTLQGGAGSDTLIGGAGNDNLEGGEGNDTLKGVVGDGTDTLNGGNGTDTADYDDGNKTARLILDLISLETTRANHVDVLIGIESVVGTDDKRDLLTVEGLSSGVTINLLSGAVSGVDDITTVSQFEYVVGGSGNDTLTGNTSDNSLEGGAGSDTLTGGDGNDTLVGGLGADLLVGENGEDLFIEVYGGGNDTINGGAGIDLVNYDDNTAVTYISLNTETGSITRGAETDTLSNVEQVKATDAKTDLLDASSNTSGVTINLALGTVAGTGMGLSSATQFEYVIGGDGHDKIIGNLAANSINGGDGNDTLAGGDGKDTLIGGDGNDLITDGLGNDSLMGGGGNDTISGGEGNDTIEGGGGLDSLIGGMGNDKLSSGAGSNTLIGGDGNDTIFDGMGNDLMVGGNGKDTFYDLSGMLNESGSDTISGGGGKEKDTVIYTEEKYDGDNEIEVALTLNLDTGIVTCGNDIDVLMGIEVIIAPEDSQSVLTASSNTSGIKINLETGGVTGAAGSIVSVKQFRHITTGSGNDLITGNTYDNSLYGGSGNDTLSGGGGSDTMDGGEGNDTFIGGSGENIVTGGGGSDTLHYLTKNNVILYTKNSSITAGGNIDTFSGLEVVQAGGHNRDLVSAAGETGNVSINLTTGNTNNLTCGVTMIMNFEDILGGSGNDTLTGNKLNNALNGNGGADTLAGGGGNDTLIGGTGNDLLQGGEKNDRYELFTGSFGADMIDDLSGSDALVLSNYSLSQVNSWSAIDMDEDGKVDGLMIDFGNGNSITILNYFDDSNADDDLSKRGSGCIETIIFSDDPKVDFTQVLNLFL